MEKEGEKGQCAALLLLYVRWNLVMLFEIRGLYIRSSGGGVWLSPGLKAVVWIGGEVLLERTRTKMMLSDLEAELNSLQNSQSSLFPRLP